MTTIIPAVFTIWPERKWISEGKIRSLYKDAVANGQCDDGKTTMMDQAQELHQAGLITLGDPKSWEK